MKVIGLCGRSGSGKGYVCALFARRGIPSIDTDAMYRVMTAPAPAPSECVREIADHFGESMIRADNSLNRAALRECVFSDPEKLALLDRIAHKHILAGVRVRLAEFEAAGVPAAIVDAPVLFESGFDSECDITVAVVAPDDLRIERIILRDGISRDAALARLGTQKNDEELIALCDLTVRNAGYNGEVERDVDRVVASALGKE